MNGDKANLSFSQNVSAAEKVSKYVSPVSVEWTSVGWKCCRKRFDSISALAVEWTSHWLEKKKSDETLWKCCPKRFYSMLALCIKSWMNHTIGSETKLHGSVVKKGFIVCQPCVSWMNHTFSLKRKWDKSIVNQCWYYQYLDFSNSSISWHNCSFHLINYPVISLAGESLMLSVTMAMTTDPLQVHPLLKYSGFFQEWPLTIEANGRSVRSSTKCVCKSSIMRIG